MSKCKFIDAQGARSEVEIDITTLREAHAKGMGVEQLINTKYPTSADATISTFSQMCASEGLIFGDNAEFGIKAGTLKDVFAASENMGGAQPASRILFPPAILAAVDDKMKKNLNAPTAAFDKLVATTTTVNNARTAQPRLHYDTPGGPEEVIAQRITPGAKPVNMLIITAADTIGSIPTYSLGIEVHDEALEGTSLDLVALSIARQREIAAFIRAGDALGSMITGDIDRKESPLTAVKANVFDPDIVAAGKLTDTAWVKWLYSDILQRQIDWVIVDSIDTALTLQNRTGRTTVNDNVGKAELQTEFKLGYPGLQDNVQLFVAPKEWALPAGTILGLQTSAAIQKFVNSSVTYDAQVRFALERKEALRFDFGEDYSRIYDDAFSLLSLTV